MTSKFRTSRRKAPAYRARKSVSARRPTASRRVGMVKRSSNSGLRALRTVRSLQRKLDITPRHLTYRLNVDYNVRISSVTTYPFTTISAHTPLTIPLTWNFKEKPVTDDYVNLNTMINSGSTNRTARISYMNLHMRFKNTTASDMIRFLIVYDKQPQNSVPVWVQPSSDTVRQDLSTGLFMFNSIDSMKYPTNRFRILYDKTKYLNPTTRAYTNFRWSTNKAFKLIQNIEHADVLDGTTDSVPEYVTYDTTRNVPNGTPLSKGNIYLLLFTDNSSYTLDTNADDIENTQFTFNYRWGIYDI